MFFKYSLSIVVYLILEVFPVFIKIATLSFFTEYTFMYKNCSFAKTIVKGSLI